MKLGASSIDSLLNEGIKINLSFWFAVVLVTFIGYPARSDNGLSSYDVLRSLISTGVVAEGATEDELLHNGTIEKRTAPVSIYFVSQDADKNEAMKRVVIHRAVAASAAAVSMDLRRCSRIEYGRSDSMRPS